MAKNKRECKAKDCAKTGMQSNTAKENCVKESCKVETKDCQ